VKVNRVEKISLAENDGNSDLKANAFYPDRNWLGVFVSLSGKKSIN